MISIPYAFYLLLNVLRGWIVNKLLIRCTLKVYLEYLIFLAMNCDLVKAKTPDDFDLKFKAIGAILFRILFCCKTC